MTRWIQAGLCIVLCTALTTGCALFRGRRKTLPTDPAPIAAVRASNAETAALRLADAVLAHPFPPPGRKTAALLVYDVDGPDTVQDVSKQVMETLIQRLRASGRLRLVRPGGAAWSLPSDSRLDLRARTGVAREMGADYMLTGRLSAKSGNWQRLVLYVTDLESGLAVVRKQAHWQ